MKKTITLSALMLMFCLSSFAQIISYPQQENEDSRCTITKIETNNQFTIISFKYTAFSDNSWAQIGKEIYIQTDADNTHYNYLKSENIAVAPEKNTLAHTGDSLLFKVYFKKI